MSRSPSVVDSSFNKRASTGASYNYVLEHVLSYPGSYKSLERDRSSATPRKTMSVYIPSHKARQSEVSIPSIESKRRSTAQPAQAAATGLTSGLMSAVGQSPAQPGSLPPVFINSFLRRCFPPDLENVDFPQALTALEYLADLDYRLRRELNAALRRLGVSRDSLYYDADNLSKKHPSIAAWVKDMQPSEKKIEALYTQLYVGLRRWILVNEFSLMPFHEYNCLAMVNILFPPWQAEDAIPPTPMLTPSVLHKQRECYLAYLKAVEKKGPHVLLNLINQNKRPGEDTGWPAVRETLDKYLRATTRLIDEAEAIGDWGTLREDRPKVHRRGSSWSLREKREKRETIDSAISISSSAGSNTSHTPSVPSISSNKPLPAKPLPPSPPTLAKAAAPTLQTPPKKPAHESTLERIARELRRFRGKHKSNKHQEQAPAATAAAAAVVVDDSNKENRTSLSSTSIYSSSPRSSVPSSSPPPSMAALTNKNSEKPSDSGNNNEGKLLRKLKSLRDLKNLSRPQTPAEGAKGDFDDFHDGRSRWDAMNDGRTSSDRKRERSRSRSRSRSGRKMHADDEAFDRDEMLRQRLIWEAKHGKS